MSARLRSATAVFAGLFLAAAGCGRRDADAPVVAEPRAVAAPTTRAAAPRREGLPVGLGSKTVTARARMTYAERAEGYMGRAHVADDEALLFVYRTSDERGFWMKNCLVPLDILYLADDGTVVGAKTVPPPAPGAADADVPRFPSPAPVRLVLEVRAGLAAEAGVGVGSRVNLPPDVAALFAEAEP